jgi:hypothetical protein
MHSLPRAATPASSKMLSDGKPLRRTKVTAGLAAFSLSLSCVLVACTWSWAYLDLQQTVLLNQVRIVSVDFYQFFLVVYTEVRRLLTAAFCTSRTPLLPQSGTDQQMNF